RIRIGKVAWERTQLALGGKPVGGNLSLARLDCPTSKITLLPEEIAHDLRAFLRFERAGAVHQEPTWLHELGCPCEQAPLDAHERGNIRWPFDPGNIGMASDRTGPGAGSIEQNGIERTGAPLQHVRFRDVRMHMKAGKVLPHAFEPVCRAIDGHDMS